MSDISSPLVTDNNIGPNFGRARIHRPCSQERVEQRQRIGALEAENARLRAALETAATDLIGFHGYFNRIGSHGTEQSIQRTLDLIDAALAASAGEA